MPKINDELTVLGDVHLGKVFKSNVPLHRLGHREEMVWSQFEHELFTVETLLMVQMGDLFESFSIDEATLLRAEAIIRKAAYYKRNTDFVFIRGNHDASRDSSKNSSFDVLEKLLKDCYNVRILKEPTSIFNYAFLPWHPYKSSDELLSEINAKDVKAVFCHCDVESYGGSEFNLVPTSRAAAMGIPTIYTGHVHLPRTFTRDGVQVNVVGSMAPYAHGEDPNNVWYQSLTAEEILSGDLSRFENVNLRVLYKGQIPALPEIDCLQLSFKQVAEIEDAEEADIEVQFEEFSIDNLFSEALKKFNVGPVVSEKVQQKLKERGNV